MNSEIEQSFVKTFIKKSNQERFLYELSSKGKRQNVLSKFSHNADKYIKEKYVVLQGDKIDADVLAKEIRRLVGKVRQCYILFETHSDVINSLEEALNAVVENYAASVMVADEVIAVIKEENEVGAAKKYLLYKQ